jgi:hypothetical protein
MAATHVIFCRRGIPQGKRAQQASFAVLGKVPVPRIHRMLVSSFKHTCGSLGRVRSSAGCILRVQENVSQLFYSTLSPQAPNSKEENTSESTTDPFLAHLQQKTEKELLEILRKQQQQQAPEQNGDEETQVISKNEMIFRSQALINEE